MQCVATYLSATQFPKVLQPLVLQLLALVGITPCIDSVEEQVAGELLDEHAESEEISLPGMGLSIALLQHDCLCPERMWH